MSHIFTSDDKKGIFRRPSTAQLRVIWKYVSFIAYDMRFITIFTLGAWNLHKQSFECLMLHFMSCYFMQIRVTDIKGVMVMLYFWLKMISLHNMFYWHVKLKCEIIIYNKWYILAWWQKMGYFVAHLLVNWESFKIM